MNTVPKTLRMLFVVHFLADIAFAVPLLFIPELFLSLLGWTVVDPFAARLFRMVTSYAFMLVFSVFNIVWVYWKLRLARIDPAMGSDGNPV